MGFSEKDKTASVSVETKATGVVVRRRDNSGGGAPVHIIVETTENGTAVNRAVDQSIVDSAWPGSSKSFKAHLLSIIGTVLT